jgi:hypothetical protein
MLLGNLKQNSINTFNCVRKLLKCWELQASIVISKDNYYRMYFGKIARTNLFGSNSI